MIESSLTFQIEDFSTACYDHFRSALQARNAKEGGQPNSQGSVDRCAEMEDLIWEDWEIDPDGDWQGHGFRTEKY